MYGTDIVLFIRKLVERKFDLVGVLGYEGTGKTYGMKSLPSGSNMWFNADGKNLTYKGGKAEYGTIEAPTGYHRLPKTYKDVLDVVDALKKKDALEPNPVAFLLAHIEDFKSADGKQRQRLKTLGKLANKVNIEDALTMCYYTDVIKEGDKVTYRLRTKNNGSDTCRSMEEQHSGLYIPNNFNEIIESINIY